MSALPIDTILPDISRALAGDRAGQHRRGDQDRDKGAGGAQDSESGHRVSPRARADGAESKGGAGTGAIVRSGYPKGIFGGIT